MEQWRGHLAVVTGASAGIGSAITIELLKHGVNVVAIARREHLLIELSNLVKEKEWRGKIYLKPCDITDEVSLKDVFNWIETNIGGISIMINNAGMLRRSTLLGGSTADWKSIFDLNVMALSACSREAYQSMAKHKINGHIIQINSIAGHALTPVFAHKMYNASKFAVTALCDGLRHELQLMQSKIKVTSISPGLVDTEIFEVAQWKPLSHGKSSDMILKSEDVANTVIAALSTPPNVLVAELIVIPTGTTIQKHNSPSPPFDLS
ncbi:farnesol dehydrogenase-like isoform X4 [Daktulosphaira vitifoliae]|uniref:farnesol dehydrogenase-like isoform X1 n=1 Tax=Daktulosphaira vitifoliae TaxID=58002 RepID=UPI0021AAF682|nr:farnesol dehydrogenase-like isoform X1 [Daktulosphaira vitifoliae]XP_050541977.1 farnesol dehydrogenase-like isoform X2 [Daktulosphaira vitifoliae]XP_050541979.1 farnesol dehydrogenase-like isoform X3 [Daktulosphaira vitifoliae]XP_050541980.1 farnesol dehydrogenase-like isoform X1 [Daktulosphaira vitifoliae]XP_050541981.1 farnesol dehydrogenase-like isoform X1 [Daktulosphaira vitifoliae]XP_050541982.1 farnesol dehydrogenase-like isoform X1 [Daktulosphaira vitifoliae]XP_050541983.1 farnesol